MGVDDFVVSDSDNYDVTRCYASTEDSWLGVSAVRPCTSFSIYGVETGCSHVV